MRTAIAVLLAAAASAVAEDRPLLHPLFAEHMVLQRDMKDPVWGWAAPGTTVTVDIGDTHAESTADANGRWQALIGPLAAGGPFELTVAAGGASATVKDVLVGDVWLCSGQSNMEMGIGIAKDAKAEIARADFPRIRLFTVPKRITLDPAPRFAAPASWDPCSPASVAKGGWGGFSAAGYYFGRHLHQKLGVPIGLIHSSWGGTPAEAWMSEQALGSLPAHLAQAEQLAALRASIADQSLEQVVRDWWKDRDPGTAAAWESPAVDDTAWKEMQLPSAWEKQGLPGWDGVVWFRRRVTVPPGWAGKVLQLELGPIDDSDTTWFDGERVGGKPDHASLRIYPIPSQLTTTGEHVIAVRVLDYGGPGGIYGKPEQMKLDIPGNAAAVIPLAGAWRYHETTPIAKLGAPPGSAVNQNSSSVLYDGMIAPLVPFAFKGAIWYQGEANAGNPADYRTLLPALIGDWRSHFGTGFPFLIVQLASYMERKPEPADSRWAELREAQAFAAATVPNCGLALAIDIGEAKDIHPKNKQEVGRRLGLVAEAVAYDRQVECSGPVFRAMEIADGKAVLSFDHRGIGLDAVGGKLLGFAIAGADGKYVWADAAIDGEHVVVSSPKVPDPKNVRYAWADNPECTLINKAGLPAVPFRTDGPK
jgi:sialate O-acetylesterase